jgi:hypothetical protein
MIAGVAQPLPVSPDDCLGHHVPAARLDCLRIDWYLPSPQGERVRVRAHTCDCQASFYELCQSGGMRFIRRTTRHGGRVVIEESERGVAAHTDAVWAMLLKGAAR